LSVIFTTYANFELGVLLVGDGRTRRDQFQDLLRLQTAVAARVVLDDSSGNFASIGAVAQSFSNDVVFRQLL
jgi:hypothetical protein